MKKGGAAHVAKIERRHNGKVYTSYLLRRTYREDGKVKHETLGNLSHLPQEVIGTIRAALRGEVSPLGDDGLKIVRSLPHGHVAAVLGTVRNIGLEQIVASRPSPERTLVVAMIVARVIDPCSKLATSRGLSSETACSSLGLQLGLDSVSEDALYEAMDWLQSRQELIEKKLAKKHLQDGTLVLYDVSSSYYTGSHCSLAKFGHSRDRKKGFPQIVYGLLCNAEGCPISIEVFEGNTADPKTFTSQIKKVRERFGLQRVVFVGDRGMITNKRIDDELRDVDGLDWITALRANTIKNLVEQGVVQLSIFDQQDLAEVTSPDFPGERLVVCRNPLLAEERSRKREALLCSTEKELEKIAQATQREKRRLKGKDKIGVRVGKVINRFKMAKHFNLEITEESFSYQRNEEKINKEAALDGLYVIRTSVSSECLDAESTVRAYKDLSKVERAFRSLKTVDLKIRPIHHRLEDRVRAHVFLCMLAYYVEWHMRQALAPILFEDEEKEAAEALRDSIVSPAQRSPVAKAKDKTKRTRDDFPAHSFTTLLKDLATLAKNLLQTAGTPAAEFYLLTEPTEPQQRAFQLLELTPSL